MHDKRVHRMDDPNVIVPLLCKYFSPDSVIDFGCGTGNFLYKFKECGATKVLGIDGEWSKNELQMLKGDELLIKNLNDEIGVKDRFDLAVSLEVAEHIDKKYAEKIIKDLANFSDVIVFSAAVPNQWGQNHINEQWPDYWVKQFNAIGYDCYDVLRPVLWNNPNVSFWYKQNMFVAVNASNKKQIQKLLSNFPSVNDDNKNVVPSLVHPDHFGSKIKRINSLNHTIKLYKGKGSLREYAKEVVKMFKKK